ncbi:hypothetical protein D3C75_995730 [compost metagenome]
MKCVGSIRGRAAAKVKTSTAMMAITTAICTLPATCIPIQFVTSPTASIPAAIAMRAPSPQPMAAVIYPAPVSAATGPPIGTDIRKNQPTTAPALGPNAIVTKCDTPPAFGYLAESSPMDRANGRMSRVINPQARREAGPAISAARPGTISTPEPSTAPM